jgi:hypothetical protein
MATAMKKARTGKGKDGGGKKPVWVDEEAHVVLKEWAALIRSSMVDAASALVLESLAGITPVKTAVLAEDDDGDDDDGEWIGAAEVAAVNAATTAPPPVPEPVAAVEPAAPSPSAPPSSSTTATHDVEPAAAAAEPEHPTAPAPPRRKSRTADAPSGGVKQHVGGVWLV